MTDLNDMFKRLFDRVTELEHQVRAIKEKLGTTGDSAEGFEADHPLPLEYGCIWNDCRHSKNKNA